MWMCDRCQAINDDNTTRCPRCGWEQHPPASAAGPAAPAAQSTPQAAATPVSGLPGPAPTPQEGSRAAALTGGLIAPSELMLFYGDQFVGPASPMVQKAPLIGKPTEVPCSALARMAVAVAFIANEYAGALRFSLDQQRTLLGLGKGSTLFVRPADTRPDWPAGCLEASLFLLLGKVSKVSDLVYELVAADAAYVENELLGLVADGMRARGVLEWENPDFPGLSWSTNVLSELGLATLQRSVAAPVERLVTDYRKNKADLWKALDREIGEAFHRRSVR